MNLLIKLHLYSHVGDKNYENKICDKMDKQYIRRESPYSSWLFYIQNTGF